MAVAGLDMSRGFVERFPNAVLEALCRRGSAKERLYLAVVRETWGWQKAQAEISFTRFRELTGIQNAAQVSRLTSQLVREGRLVKVSVWGRPCIYSAVGDPGQWIDLPEGESVDSTGSTDSDGSIDSVGNTASEVNGSTDSVGKGSTAKFGKGLISTAGMKEKGRDMEGISPPVPSVDDVESDAPPDPPPREKSVLEQIQELFKILMLPNQITEMDWAELGALVQEGGEEKVLRFLESADRARVYRRSVLPYVAKCLKNDERGGGYENAGRDGRPSEYGL